MNFISRFFLLLLIPVISQGQELRTMIFPELDQKLLALRTSLINHSFDEAILHVQLLEDSWFKISGELLQIQDDRIMLMDLAELQNLRIYSIEQMVSIHNAEKALYYVDNFYTELRDARNCIGDDYPLDQLWKSKESYEELSHVVNDPMLQLREWYELEDLVDDLSCNWEAYELLYQDLIPIYFPDFDVAKQKDLFREMYGSINGFKEIMRSGFRPDFVDPCDRMGEIIEENLKLYQAEEQFNIQ
jgi:hypothetical protein